jgi:hypothetical protein
MYRSTDIPSIAFLETISDAHTVTTILILKKIEVEMGMACSTKDQKFRTNNLIGGLRENVNIMLKWYIAGWQDFDWVSLIKSRV